MADYSVIVVNEHEIDVYDTSSHSMLEEIRDLLKEILKRLPPEPQKAPPSENVK